MQIEPIQDGNSDFGLVKLFDSGNTGRLTPHCKLHGAMLKVSEKGIWRCIRAISLKTGKCINDCRAGCVEYTEKHFTLWCGCVFNDKLDLTECCEYHKSVEK